MKESESAILLVDDSKSARCRFGEILEAEGHQVIVAGDGQEGLEKLKQNAVDLIVSDLEMPLLDGIGLCKAVKADSELRHIYFILLTARTELKTRVKGLHIGADDYIVKTTHPAEFKARVSAGLRLRRLEQELQRSRAHLFHAEKMAAIGTLTAGLAHEINNPLGYLCSNHGTLKKHLERLAEHIRRQDAELNSHDGRLSEGEQINHAQRSQRIDRILADSQALLDESREGTDRIASIVSGLQSFLGTEAPRCQLLDLNRSLALAIDLLQQTYPQLRAPVTDFTELPLLNCYPHHLNQVFVNLLDNAAQAVSTGGEVQVASRCQEDEIIVVISDNGCGISEKNQNRIFDPFFTTREVGQGTGLGLTVAYDIVRKHGGAISMVSRVNEGSSFTVRLPVHHFVEP